MIKRVIFSLMCLLAAALVAGCEFDPNGKPGEQEFPGNKARITLFLAGSVTDGLDPIPGVRVKIYQGEEASLTNESGVFLIETVAEVTIGDPYETVYLVAIDPAGAFLEKTVPVTIGEWSNNEKSISSIRIEMERAAR